MTRIHLISNAHLDPVWQWEWEEGAAAAVSTFRCAADFCEEFDEYVFCHNEALLYRWIEEYEPALFARIQRLVEAGKWHIMGGWHLQPDCNMPAGESFVRQILTGRIYFKEKFGKVPTTAINFDPFGHTRGLVQILAKSGYDSYLFMRPSESSCHLPAESFTWVGYDGSTVMGQRVSTYNTALGHAAESIRARIAREPEKTVNVCLWGVGDHGGGASRGDIRDIAALTEELAKDGITVIHSTPEQYFAELREKGDLPRHEGDLNAWAVGCYTSQVRIKQKHRLLESQLYSTERMCVHAAEALGIPYPKAELEAAQYDLVTVEFHDSLPGSSIQPVEEMCLRMIDHGLEICSRIRARAFFALCAGQKEARDGEIPILCYNPHPYEVEDDFEVEFMLEDQNWSNTFTEIQVYHGETAIPAQVEKEQSNIPLDWRKRVSFHATPAPMQITRFDCRLSRKEAKRIPSLPEDGNAYFFDNGRMQAHIGKESGLIERLTVDGAEMLAPGALSIGVHADNEDPWGMTVNGFYDKIGAFTLLSPEECTRFSSLPETVASVRVIEDGDVRSVVEAVFGYERSRAVVHYLLSKTEPTIDLSIRICNCETKVMYKLYLPMAAENVHATAEVAYGEEPILKGGIENPGQKYVRMTAEGKTMTVFNRGIYGYSMTDSTLMISLMRAPAYTAHPLPGRSILPTDRHMPYIEQG
ncbi:MAG: alpha-mannosidase, partial [Clostridia bacterium]|nr:alpha-mannosidase [Clostridia bacterium]